MVPNTTLRDSGRVRDARGEHSKNFPHLRARAGHEHPSRVALPKIMDNADHAVKPPVAGVCDDLQRHRGTRLGKQPEPIGKGENNGAVLFLEQVSTLYFLCSNGTGWLLWVTRTGNIFQLQH